MKKILLLLLSLLGLLLVPSGCAKTADIEPAAQKICKSSIKNKVGTIWKFTLNQDNKILKVVLETHISEDYLKQKYPKDIGEIDKIYADTKDSFIREYDAIAPATETKKWFKASIKGNDKKMNIQTSYSFDFTGEHFAFELNDDFLNTFGIMKLYDKKNDALIYSPDKILTSLFSKETKAVCK